MKKIVVLSMVLLLMGFVAAASAANFTFYTSLSEPPADFLSYCPTPVAENFEDAVFVPGFSITEVGGAGSLVASSVYQNIVDAGTPRTQTFNYAPGMTAFGGWFDLAKPGGPGVGIDVYVADTNTFVATLPNTFSGQFWAFSSDTSFTGVKFVAGSGSGSQETYQIVDAYVCPVPVPNTLLFLGSGLLGLLGLRRKN